jgi:hypothetical protein
MHGSPSYLELLGGVWDDPSVGEEKFGSPKLLTVNSLAKEARGCTQSTWPGLAARVS